MALHRCCAFVAQHDEALTKLMTVAFASDHCPSLSTPICAKFVSSWVVLYAPFLICASLKRYYSISKVPDTIPLLSVALILKAIRARTLVLVVQVNVPRSTKVTLPLHLSINIGRFIALLCKMYIKARLQWNVVSINVNKRSGMRKPCFFLLVAWISSVQ